MNQKLLIALSFTGLIAHAADPAPKTPPSAGLINDWLRSEFNAAKSWDLGGQFRVRSVSENGSRAKRSTERIGWCRDLRRGIRPSAMDKRAPKLLTKETLRSNPALASLILRHEVQRLRAKASDKRPRSVSAPYLL